MPKATSLEIPTPVARLNQGAGAGLVLSHAMGRWLSIVNGTRSVGGAEAAIWGAKRRTAQGEDPPAGASISV